MRLGWLVSGLALGSVGCANQTPQTEVQPEASAVMCEPNQGLNLYDERIDPLFRNDQPSTCNQCHLTGLDLRQYVRASPCETFSCLVKQGLVDTNAPKQSKVLGWISRAEPESTLITQQVIDAEYSAFLEWITYNTECDECTDVPCTATLDGGTFCEDEYAFAEFDAGSLLAPSCGEADVAELFRTTVYRNRGRCSPCHINEGENAKYGAPLWIEVQPDCATASLKTFENARNAGYLNVDDPSQSLLLLKPLPEELGGVMHGGHDKFDALNDPGYESILYFIQHLAECENPDAG